jgi:hypothetical protein
MERNAESRGNGAKRPARLNNKFVAALPRGEMWWDEDPKATGFGVRAYPGGGKSFFLDYRLDGRQRRITIGPFPRWSADAARERARELRKQIDRGHDPAGAKRERRTAPTVQDLIDRYIADHLPKKSREKVRVADEKQMLAEIGKHSVDQRRPGGLPGSGGRRRAPHHAHRVPAGGSHEGNLVGVRHRTRLLDQAIRPRQAAQDA